MLSQLSIQNIAVIEKASIDFEAGFSVLTGETGAGKSIIIDALHAVLGERTSKDLIRTGAQRAYASALFTDVSPSILKDAAALGISLEEDDTLLLRREIRAGGKSVCKVNGQPVTVSMLKRIGMQLVGIHGQHDSYELLSETAHMGYLDAFGELEALLAEYQTSYEALKKLQKDRAELDMDESQKSRREDLLRYQIEEISEANVIPGEQEQLAAEREAIRNSGLISEAVGRAKMTLAGDDVDGGVLSGVTTTLAEVETAAQYVPELAEPCEKLREAGFLLEDVNAFLRDLPVDFDPTALNDIEARLDELYKLSLKYGETEQEMLDFLAACQQELHNIEYAQDRKAALDAKYEAEKEVAIRLAKELSQKRKASADRFAVQVMEALAFLNMPGVVLSVQIDRVPLNAYGCDKIQFLVSANKGEPPKPMSKIASGGELSRIMLAIKTVIADKDQIETLIFDEIDTGISGDAGNKVGEKLKAVSRNRQVICITHLAQIAALANQHYAISKHQEEERTFTDVMLMDRAGRIEELSRMVGGSSKSEIRRKMAAELLDGGAAIQ